MQNIFLKVLLFKNCHLRHLHCQYQLFLPYSHHQHYWQLKSVEKRRTRIGLFYLSKQNVNEKWVQKKENESTTTTTLIVDRRIILTFSLLSWYLYTPAYRYRKTEQKKKKVALKKVVKWMLFQSASTRREKNIFLVQCSIQKTSLFDNVIPFLVCFVRCILDTTKTLLLLMITMTMMTTTREGR